MKKFINTYFIAIVLLVFSVRTFAQQENVVKYVDPFIGTENSGNVFPGPSLPFGMVRLSPDCKTFKGKSPNTNSGYVSKAPMYGFSHTHVSGTGGGAKYGNILFMPTTGAVDIKNHESEISEEVAKPGYYAVKLDKFNIKAELTSTHSVGVHRYTFPKTDEANIIIDVASFLVKGSTIQKLVNSEVKVLSNTTVQGVAIVAGGWNEGAPYTVYFYAEFDTPANQIETWRNGILTDAKVVKAQNGEKISSGVVLHYRTKANQQIVAKVGISFVSIEKAKQNLQKETNNKSFDVLKQIASETWNALLSKVKVNGSSQAHKRTFYTALYHVFLMPSDRTGENPLWQSSEPYYDDYYAIWDTYRASNPLITLLDAKRQEDIIRSLVDIYAHEGFMPDARSGNDNGLIQSGTNSDILIADAWVKGLKNIDYQKAYQAMLKNAEVEPERPKKEGREGIENYKILGYVPFGISIAGSRTLEYANNDFAIATVAKGLGLKKDYNKYLDRASNWQHLWRADVQSHGATGFIWPKNTDGAWQADFDVFRRGNFKGFLYEGNSWTYSLNIPHDVKKLIELCGGNKAFINRLDTFFLNKYYDVNNEPGFLTPCLYAWTGRQDKVAKTVNNIRSTYYHDNRAGLPGNDDSGAMSAWFAMHALGFYPNAGTDIYIISTPLFQDVNLTMANGKSIHINAINLSNENIYVQTAKLNGKVLNKAWFKHSDIANGGEIELMMGANPSNWALNNPPPSLSD